MDHQPLAGVSEDVLDVYDPEAAHWIAQQAQEGVFPDVNGGRIHLYLGDSIARDAKVGVRETDLLFKRARGGDSWHRLRSRLPQELEAWRSAARGYGVALGSVVIWMSGNDVYPDGDAQQRCQQLERLGDNVAAVVGTLRGVASDVHVVGPLPRLAHDQGRAWEQCPAFHAERRTKDTVRGLATFWLVGRAMTTFRKKRHVVDEVVPPLYRRDKVHLTREGYKRIFPRLPKWLQ